ncbi:hypothetical protein PQ455_20840 (plasmid) [Sphingomonas naphthae]|uniref:Uncharacterized protein n=1 Tax=Sphingomonas naphthae TaxID=1813468 RepID=A0ABY7TRN3_9SPHN|nr:hypothetical protein [Sphingomonas naphthae]WCT75872.1 hypothetical protein PQ455_20840 [Sphingomonas naphthae]
MSTKIQVNIRLTPEEHARLLKCAGEAGLERAMFARDLVMEGLDRKAGGEPTAQRTLPGPGNIVAMDAMLNNAIMEVERFANKWAAHEAELLSLERKDRLAMHSARVEFLTGFPERISRSLEPIKAEMTAMKAAITDQPRLDAIDTKQAELVEAVQANTRAIRVIRKDPRKAFGIILADGGVWSTLFVCQWSLFMVAIGMFVISAFGMTLPGIGIPLAHKLAAGDAEFCRLIRYRFEVDGCQVPADHRIDAAAAPAAASGTSSRTKASASSAKAKRS